MENKHPFPNTAHIHCHHKCTTNRILSDSVIHCNSTIHVYMKILLICSVLTIKCRYSLLALNPGSTVKITGTLLWAGKCPLLFISLIAEIYISDIWNLFQCQNWLYHWSNGLLVKQFTLASLVDSMAKNWWNCKVAMLPSKINTLNWNGKK